MNHFMKTLFVVMVLALVAVVSSTTSQCRADEPDLVDIGSRRELLVDYFLIDKMDGVRLVLNRPRDEGVVVSFDQPWEGPFCGYCTVIHDRSTYHLYYRGLPSAGADGSPKEVTCYAESHDGIHWKKPDLGLFKVHGHTKNNVILANAAPVTHNFCPMVDSRKGVPAEQRFKAIGGTMPSGLIAWASPDGVHWKKLRDQAVINRRDVPFPYMFDSQNVAFWSPVESKYLCYFRVFKDGIRRICRSMSDDFVHWSKPVLMEYRHAGKPAPIEHLYTNQTHPYFRAPQIYVSIAARFMPGRQVITAAQAKVINVNPGYFKDTSDAVLMTSRGDGIYDRTFLSSFIRPGIGAHNWVSRTNYPALNVVQTGPTEMSVYVNQDYAQPSAHLRRYSMRLDGFGSAQADYFGGTLLTRPLIFSGKHLSINFSTSAAGSIRVALLTAEGKPMKGFTADDCQEQIGNEIERVVSWKTGPDVARWAGKPVRLRFVMKDADLYAFRFGE